MAAGAAGFEPRHAAVGEQTEIDHSRSRSRSRSSAASSNCLGFHRATELLPELQIGLARLGPDHGSVLALVLHPRVMRGAMETSQQLAQRRIECHVALRATHPPGLPKILERPAGTTNFQRGRQQRRVQPTPLAQLGEKTAQRGVGHGEPGLDALVRGALGAEARGVHLALLHLGEAHDALALPAVAAFHPRSASAPYPTAGASTPSERVSTRSARPASARLWVTITIAVRNCRASPEKSRVQLLGVLLVEVAGGLVRQQQRGLHRERPRHGRALLLAAGELRRQMGAAAAQPHRIQQLPRARLRLGSRGAGDQQRQGHVFQGGEVAQQMMKLEHESDSPVPELGQAVGVELVVRRAAEPDLPRGGKIQRAEQVEQGALARPALAGHRHKFAGFHREIDASQDFDGAAVAAPVRLAKVARLEDGAHSWRIASTGVSRAAARDGCSVATTATSRLNTTTAPTSTSSTWTGR